MKIRNLFHLRSYLTEKNKCFIPLCRAHCCADAPLPEPWVNSDGRLALRVREPYSAFNVGRNEAIDNYDSIMFNTRPVPLISTGIATKQNNATKEMEYVGTRYFFDRQLAEALGMKNQQEAIDKLMEFEANKVYNYCPFLNEQGRCVVYDRRPRICREFGNDFVRPINHCHDKSSKLDIIKFYLKELTPKKMFIFYKNRAINLFKKAQPAG